MNSSKQNTRSSLMSSVSQRKLIRIKAAYGPSSVYTQKHVSPKSSSAKTPQPFKDKILFKTTPKFIIPKPENAAEDPNREKRTIQGLRQEILSAKSDQIELMRDLATYEITMCEQLNIPHCLSELQVAQKPASVALAACNAAQLVLLQAQIDSSLASVACPAVDSECREIRKEDYSTHTISPFHNYGHLKNYIRKISGVFCLISLQCDVLYSNYIISLSLPSKLQLRLHKQLTLPIRDYEDSRAIHKDIREKLLSALYFTIENTSLAIKCDENHRSKFINLFIHVKGAHTPKLIQISQEADKIFICYLGRDQYIGINKKLLDIPGTIYDYTDTVLSRKLLKHLQYEHTEDLILWLDTSDRVYTKKERMSKLMDLKYIHSTVGSMPFNTLKQVQLAVDGTLYYAAVVSFMDLEAVEITSQKVLKRIDSTSKLGVWLKQMQFHSFREHPLSLLKSIELKTAIRYLFNH